MSDGAVGGLGGAALGRARVGLVQSQRLGIETASSGAPQDHRLSTWLSTLPMEELRGVSIDQLPAAVRSAFGWVGVPLSRSGPRWGVEVREAALHTPQWSAACIVVPPPERLRACSGIDLKPLRAWVARQWGCRLQAGPGLFMFQWPSAVLLISCRDIPLGGFLHGPQPGSRATIAIAPGEFMLQRW